jgi:hypothetical protein
MKIGMFVVLLGWLVGALLPLRAAAPPAGFPVAVEVIGPDAALNESITAGLRKRIEGLEAVRITDAEPWCALRVLAQPTPEDAQHPHGCVLAVTHTNRLNILLLLTKLKGAPSKTEHEIHDLAARVLSKDEPLRHMNAVHLPDASNGMDDVLDRLVHDFEEKQIIQTRELLRTLQQQAAKGK